MLDKPTDETLRGRILYILYANPAAYPPLEHSSRILADAGWQVTLFGSASRGTESLRMPQHERITFRLWNYQRPGVRQKLHYLAFCAAALFMGLRTRAKWVYASDPLACPAGWLMSLLGWRVIYHEHDGPNAGDAKRSSFMRFILAMRSRLARRAEFCVLPNASRAERFRVETGTSRDVLTVMNCPGRAEAEAGGERKPGGPFVFFYHGTIVPARLPMSVVQAISRLPEGAILRIAGYETVGHPGYVTALKVEAARLGVAERVEYLGTMPQRADLLAECRRAHAGISLMPLATSDVNEQSMAGASNKAFDYLACGVPVLVSELPEWEALFVSPGYGQKCKPEDPESILSALQWFIEHPEQAREMGGRGRKQVRQAWNYEAQFEHAFSRLRN